MKGQIYRRDIVVRQDDSIVRRVQLMSMVEECTNIQHRIANVVAVPNRRLWARRL